MNRKKEFAPGLKYSNWRIRKQIIEIFNKVETFLFNNSTGQQLEPVRVYVKRNKDQK